MFGATKPTGSELVAEIGDVVHDLPAFLAAPMLRHWHLRWGARPDEVAAELPGDDFHLGPAPSCGGG